MDNMANPATDKTPTLDLGPNLFSLYPEYLTDPMILICPSSPRFGQTVTNMKRNDKWCLNGVDPSDKCASAVDNSYVYMGWCLDKFGYVSPGANLSLINTLMTQFAPNSKPRTLPTDMTTGGLPQLTGLVECLMNNGGLASATLGKDVAGMGKAVDSDVTLVAPYLGQGNGGANIIYRLRDGVERFLITDINNAGSANVSQSSIPITLDLVAIDQTAFNHIPGGSNVLYMDGHVDFSKYDRQGNGICNQLTANTVGVISVIL
jgi:prepilin-type processing-associated H-X9-DG protein